MPDMDTETEELHYGFTSAEIQSRKDQTYEIVSREILVLVNLVDCCGGNPSYLTEADYDRAVRKIMDVCPRWEVARLGSGPEARQLLDDVEETILKEELPPAVRRIWEDIQRHKAATGHGRQPKQTSL